MSFTCPACSATSYNPNDERYGYCGRCHDHTGHLTSTQLIAARQQYALSNPLNSANLDMAEIAKLSSSRRVSTGQVLKSILAVDR